MKKAKKMNKSRMNRYASMLGISVISGQKFGKFRKKKPTDLKIQIRGVEV